MTRSRSCLLLGLLLLAVGFFAFGLYQHFTLANIKVNHDRFSQLVREQPVAATATFIAVYVSITGLSLPGAALLSLLAGALFGLLWGTAVVCAAALIGPALAFASARFLFRDLITARWGMRLAGINRGLERDGALYLFMLRLVPVMPFFLVNLLMGLSSISLRTFVWVSQIAMLPSTVIYVNFGTQLSRIESVSDLLSPVLLLSMTALGFFPIIARRMVGWLKVKTVYRG